jgi:hypothetical protein
MSTNYKIVEELRAPDQETCTSNPHPDWKPRHIFPDKLKLEAASLIQELGEALEPFAGDAENWDEMGDTRPLENDGISKLTVADLRRARSILSKLKEA